MGEMSIENADAACYEQYEIFREAQDYLEKRILGASNAERVRRKWQSDAEKACLQIYGDTTPVIKVLRKGTPMFPASIRYIGSQMHHASHGGTGAGAELLRDILYTWVIGTFRVPVRGAVPRSEMIRRWSTATPAAIFEHVSESSKNSTLHDIIRNFVTGIVGNHAHMQWAMCTPAAFPVGGAIWSMLGKIVGSYRGCSEHGSHCLPSHFVSAVFRIPLISAKRLKRYFLRLTADEQRTITLIANRRKMNTCVQIRRLCEDDSQEHLTPVLVPFCNACCTVRWGKRRSEVRLQLSRGGSSQIVCTCGSTDISIFTLRGFVVTCGSQTTRLCSECGIIICDSDIYYRGIKGVCQKCVTKKYPTCCLMCDSPATFFGIADHTEVYGLCSGHTTPFHYSASLKDIKTVLQERSQS